MEKQRNSSDRTRSEATPPAAPLHAPGVRAAERTAEREQQWQERQDRAREQAEKLIGSARASGTDPHMSLASVARRAATLLAVARCDILLMDGDRRAVRYRMNENLGTRDWNPWHPVADNDSQTVSVQALAIKPGRSPLELLRSDGPVNRIYAFMNAPGSESPIGILCVQTTAGNRLALDARIFLDALADRLAAALVNDAFAGWREANATALPLQ